MKRLASFLVMAGVAVACGGSVFDPNDSGTSDAPSSKDAPVADEGVDGSPDAFSCGTTTCSGAGAVCIHSCCGGAIECAPYEDGGTCPPGLEFSPTCPSQAPCSNVCVPPAPKCGTTTDCEGMVEGHDCYLVCA